MNRKLDYGLFWAGQFTSRFGDAIFHIAVIWLALELTGSKSAMGLISMAGYLPALVFGLAAGAVADRVDRRRLMMASDVVQGLAVLTIPALHHFGVLQGWQLGAAAFVVATGAAFFSPARDSFLPMVSDPQRLLRANSWMHVSGHVAWVLGPIVAGALITLVGTVHLFTLDAATFLISFISLALLRVRPDAAGGAIARPSAWADVREGLVYAWGSRRLRGLLVMTALNNLIIMGPAVVGTPIFIKEELGGGALDYAVLSSLLFAGMATCALLMGKFGEGLPKGKTLLVGVILDGLTFLPFAWCESFVSMGALLYIHGLAVPLLVSSRPTIVQEHVPDALRGRVFSLIDLTVVGSTALSCGLTGIVAEAVSMRTIYLFIGVGGALCGIIGFSARELARTR